MQQNKIRDIARSLVSEVCSSVAVEPDLQQLVGEKLHGGSAIRSNGALVDVAADGFGSQGSSRLFFKYSGL